MQKHGSRLRNAFLLAIMCHRFDVTCMAVILYLKGKTQSAYTNLPANLSLDISEIKKAVLSRFCLVNEDYHRHFRSANLSGSGKTYSELCYRLGDIFSTWRSHFVQAGYSPDLGSVTDEIVREQPAPSAEFLSASYLQSSFCFQMTFNLILATCESHTYNAVGVTRDLFGYTCICCFKSFFMFSCRLSSSPVFIALICSASRGDVV